VIIFDPEGETLLYISGLKNDINPLVGLGIVQNEPNTSKVDRSTKLGTNMPYGVLIEKNILAQKNISKWPKNSRWPPLIFTILTISP